MNVKTKGLRNSLFIFFIIISFLLFPVNSSATFDELAKERLNKISIGEWSMIASPDSIIDTILNENDWKDFEYDSDIHEYLFDLIFEKYDPAFPNDQNKTSINPLYTDYTISEVREVIGLIEDFTDTFLIRDNNGDPIFPEAVAVEAVPLDITQKLLPGQNLQVHKVLQTANITSESPNGWIPITIILSLEAPEDAPANFNISDFAVEMLIDANSFSENNPMSYRYVLWDANSTSNKNRLQSNSYINIGTFQNKIEDMIEYNTEVKTGTNYNASVLFKHKLTKPTLSGGWNRLLGPNYYLGKPGTSNSNHQTYHAYKGNETRMGMILNGTADGRKSEIRIDIPFRNPQDSYVIPIVINLSRGWEVGKTPEHQQSEAVLPLVKIKIVKGSFLWND